MINNVNKNIQTNGINIIKIIIKWTHHILSCLVIFFEICQQYFTCTNNLNALVWFLFFPFFCPLIYVTCNLSNIVNFFNIWIQLYNHSLFSIDIVMWFISIFFMTFPTILFLLTWHMCPFFKLFFSIIIYMF